MDKMPGPAPRPPRRRFNWNRLLIIVHRDVGYTAAVLTVVYAVSGIAVNHIDAWNPNYKVAKEERRFEPFPVTDRATMVKELVERLTLPGPPKESFRRSPERIEMFYEGWTVSADATAGIAILDRPRDRFLLRDFNFLHLNHAKGLWTWVADLYAVALCVLAASGVFLLRGRQGFRGRGKWLVLAGTLIPLAFVLALRYV